jgi:hypothetical protein
MAHGARSERIDAPRGERRLASCFGLIRAGARAARHVSRALQSFPRWTVRPVLNSRADWTRRVPHPVLIGRAAPRTGLLGVRCLRSVAVLRAFLPPPTFSPSSAAGFALPPLPFLNACAPEAGPVDGDAGAGETTAPETPS